MLGNLGANVVGIGVDIDSVGHRLLVVVFHHQVLLEEAEGLLGGGRGQADEEGVEVFQHLPPQVVDGAVTLVGDDEVEGLDGNIGVVLHRRRLTVHDVGVKAGKLLQLRVQLLPLEQRIDPLNGGDTDAAHRFNVAGLEELDVV